MFLIFGSNFSVLGILISWNVKKMAQQFLWDIWYTCMDDLSLFQEYPRLLLISFHGDLKPISQATQYMYQGTYFKIMYIHASEKIFNECVSQNRESHATNHI